jgi:exosortase
MSQLVHTPSEALPEASAPFRFLTWRQTWRLAVVVGCLLLAYAPVLAHLLRQWWDEPDYSHGFIVPVFALWVLWERRDELRSIAPRPHWAGLAVIVLSLVLLVLGTFGAELFLQRISLPLLIAGLVLWFRGWPTLRASAFPLLVLLLAIPFPGVIYFQIVFPLQILASRLATWFLHAIDLFPVLREGNVIVLSNTRLEVAEACSGVRSLLSLLTIAVIYSYIAERRVLVRWLLCLLVVPIAIAGNAGRVVFAACSAEMAGASAVEGWGHFLSGIFLFFLSTLLLVLAHVSILAAGRRLGWLHPEPGGDQ